LLISACTATAAPGPASTPPPVPSPMPSPSYSPPPIPDLTPSPDRDATWNAVKSWAYQLSGYTDDKLDAIAASGFDLAVVDLARDGSADFFTREEVRAVQATGKVVLAYFEIGAIETYRPEWPDVAADLKLGSVEGWPDEQYVAYWDERWWPIVQGRIDQALDAGFDGAYLDMVVAYEEIPAGTAGTNRDDLARRIVALLNRISVYAKERDPAFKIVPQNAPELHIYAGYLDAIDGLGMEELWFQATDRRCTESWCAENLRAVKAIYDAGKLVLTVDYADRPQNVTAAYEASRAQSFVPYVTTVDLDVLRVNPGWDP
jgi:cysteinyl-tRNA synthetase, unknown class